MHKVHKYIRKFTDSITESKSSESCYYQIGNLKIRVSGHVKPAVTSHLNILISNNDMYVLVHPHNGKIIVYNYEELKGFIKTLYLHHELFFKAGDLDYQQKLEAKIVNLQNHITNLETKLSVLKIQAITSIPNTKVVIAPETYFKRNINPSRSDDDKVRIYGTYLYSQLTKPERHSFKGFFPNSKLFGSDKALTIKLCKTPEVNAYFKTILGYAPKDILNI